MSAPVSHSPCLPPIMISVRPIAVKVLEVRMVTDASVGVLRAVVILPSCLDFTVVHRLLCQTSTCRDHGRNDLVTEDCVWITSG